MLSVLPTQTLLKGIGAVGGIALVLAGAAWALSEVSKNLKIGPALVALGGFALILVAFGYVLDKVRDIDIFRSIVGHYFSRRYGCFVGCWYF